MIKILSICASPVSGSSTELLLRRIAAATRTELKVRSSHELIRLSDYDIAPCQACGEAPTPAFCFLDDAMTDLYRKLEKCDCLLFGSPIYFDSVSAQAKLFIDRCNCIRPYNFGRSADEHHFVRRWQRRRPGAMVLVGSEKAWFEGARRCVAGFFKWVEVTNETVLPYMGQDAEAVGSAVDSAEALGKADEIGLKLARILRSNHVRR